MGKPLGDPDLFFILCAQDLPDPASKCWLPLSKIHGHVKYDSGYNSNQLSLRLPDLIVQTSPHIFRGSGVVILNEGDVLANGRIKCPGIKALEEKAPIVSVETRLDNKTHRVS